VNSEIVNSEVMTSPLLARARTRARIARDRYRRLRHRLLGVHGRLAALEEEVQECRQLNRRIAELTDVVAELLVLVDDRDEERVREVLAQYRASF
jgi:hypothetical protein